MGFEKLPPEIFEEILLMIPERLDTCKLVCSDWHAMIKKNLWESPSKRWGPIIKARIERSWREVLPSDEKIAHAKMLEDKGILPTDVIESLARRIGDMLRRWSPLPETISCAANLARRGLLGPVKVLILANVDLSSVPTERLSSLVSSVTETIHIKNVSGCNLVNIIDSFNKIQFCCFGSQILNQSSTKALVGVLEDRVSRVALSNVTLDIQALVKYSGQGTCMCRNVACAGDTAARYRGEMISWAIRRNWAVVHDSKGLLQIQNL